MNLEQQQAYAQALLRIEKCRDEGGGSLDVSGLGLTRLPPEVGGLSRLTSLQVSDNELAALPPEIARLEALTSLDAKNNQLGHLPPEIGELSALRSLSLSGNKLQQLPPEIGRLAELRTLTVVRCQLVELPVEIGRLTALRYIDLDRNLLMTLPAAFGELDALETLYLNGNRLRTLPLLLGEFTSLTNLMAGSNGLSSLPAVIDRLVKLRSLYLSNNELVALPSEIGRLAALETLHLDDNQLLELPAELTRLPRLTGLFLHGNPGLQIPESILGPTSVETGGSDNKTAARPQDILSFYFSLREGSAQGTLRAVNEVKVMLVGRGGAGKTSLRRFFMREPHDKEEKETPGISLDSFTLQCAQGEITARLWDFAGQEITHALHQFFLTEGCVYVLVLDPRSNTEMRDADYWLGLLRRYAGGAPVLLALNRQDARPGGYDVDRRALLERFPFIRSFTLTNCEKREGCETLLQSLRIAVESLKDTEPPHLKVPQTWLQVMEDCDLETRGAPQPGGNKLLRWLGLAGHAVGPTPGRQRLTLDEFRAICARRGETEAAKQESLARLLHKLGAVLHFVDEPRLRDTAVLSPHWLTDGVYRLLRFKDRPESDGTLTLADALAALPTETEPTARFFLQLMERFEMCFPLDEEDSDKPPTRWLIPGAMGEFQPEGVTTEWQTPGSVRMRYVYDPLPEGVLPRFIVLTHLLSEGQPRWRNGVVLRDGDAAALVRRGEKRNHVEVTAFGPEGQRLRLLEIIQGNLERIHADLPDPKPVAELELTGLPGTFRALADLEAAELGKQQVAVDTRQGKALVEPTPQLNQASEPESRDELRVPLNAFLSYSHEDKKAKAIFQHNLTVMAKKRLTTHWHDGLIEPGERWRAEIDENLGKMDVFVGLLTTAFLASDFIEKVELKAARQRLDRQDRDFLFVLILVDDISLEGLDLAEYQILKPGDKAVSQHQSRKEGFNVAQKELEQLILKRQGTRSPRERDEPAPRMPDVWTRVNDGITILVRGDYVSGDKSVSQDMSIHMRDNYGQVGQALTHCSNMVQRQAPGERRDALETLANQVKALIAALPADQQDQAPHVAENLEMLVKQATSEKPSRKWYSVSAEGLLEASKFVKDFGGNIAGTLARLDKLVWPGEAK